MDDWKSCAHLSLGGSCLKSFWETPLQDNKLQKPFLLFPLKESPIQDEKLTQLLSFPNHCCFTGSASFSQGCYYSVTASDTQWVLCSFFSFFPSFPLCSVLVCSLSAVPTAPPQNVQVEAVNSTTIQFLWNPPPQQFINGINQGYKVSTDFRECLH